MNRPDVLAIPGVMPMNNHIKLSEVEQTRLVRAIETAIDVHLRDQFRAWMSGPFRDLLPHESMVCLEIGDQGQFHLVEFLQHSLIEAEIIDFICNPAHGLAVRLTRLFRSKARMSYAVASPLFESLLESYTGNRHPEAVPVSNAVVHRTRFLSGAEYHFILFNVPPEHLEHSPHLFKLLSSHLKMALSRVINTEEMKSHVSLTDRELEMLRWMADNKSRREIAVALGISPITVKNHISKIYRKLDVENRADAVARGLGILAALHRNAAALRE
jgi:DNA-binding CsgD family transcriptional regulator